MTRVHLVYMRQAIYFLLTLLLSCVGTETVDTSNDTGQRLWVPKYLFRL